MLLHKRSSIKINNEYFATTAQRFRASFTIAQNFGLVHRFKIRFLHQKSIQNFEWDSDSWNYLKFPMRNPEHSQSCLCYRRKPCNACVISNQIQIYCIAWGEMRQHCLQCLLKWFVLMIRAIVYARECCASLNKNSKLYLVRLHIVKQLTFVFFCFCLILLGFDTTISISICLTFLFLFFFYRFGRGI